MILVCVSNVVSKALSNEPVHNLRVNRTGQYFGTIGKDGAVFAKKVNSVFNKKKVSFKSSVCCFGNLDTAYRFAVVTLESP
jgi:hypothetical protein